jgi:hypothetical protein
MGSTPRAQAKGKRDQQHAGGGNISTDPNNQRKRAGTGEKCQQYA